MPAGPSLETELSTSETSLTLRKTILPKTILPKTILEIAIGREQEGF
jgi:hypothetical protein